MELRKIIKDILRENEGITPQNLKNREFDIGALFTKKTNKARFVN